MDAYNKYPPGRNARFVEEDIKRLQRLKEEQILRQINRIFDSTSKHPDNSKLDSKSR